MALPAPPSPPSPPSRRFPVVLFDLDGTLIDSIELLVSSMLHAFSTWRGPRPTVEEWVATIGRPLAWQFGQYASSEGEVRELVAAYRGYQQEHHDRLTRAYPAIPPLVERLGALGHPMGIVTSKGDALAQRAIAHVGLSSFFSVLVGADRTTRHKPDPDPIWLALRELGAEPQQAVYVGDSPFDVRSANAAGVRSIGVTWGAAARPALQEVGATHIVGNVGELETLLAKLRDGSGT